MCLQSFDTSENFVCALKGEGGLVEEGLGGPTGDQHCLASKPPVQTGKDCDAPSRLLSTAFFNYSGPKDISSNSAADRSDIC